MAGPSPKYPHESADLCYEFRPASPPSSSASPLTAADVAHFNERGFTPPITVFAGAALEALQATFAEHASGYPRPAGEPFRAFHPEDRGLYDVLANPTTVAAVQTLVGSENVVVHISQFVDKPPAPEREGRPRRPGEARCAKTPASREADPTTPAYPVNSMLARHGEMRQGF